MPRAIVGKGLRFSLRHAPCAHICRYCLISESRKRSALSFSRFERLVHRFHDWTQSGSRQDLEIGIFVGPSFDYDIEILKGVARLRARRGSNQCDATEGSIVTFKGATSSLCDRSTTLRSISLMAYSTLCASTRPCVVSSRRRVRRLNRLTPSSSSNPRMRWLTALCVRFSSLAASVKLRCRAATTKIRNESSEGVRGMCHF